MEQPFICLYRAKVLGANVPWGKYPTGQQRLHVRQISVEKKGVHPMISIRRRKFFLQKLMIGKIFHVILGVVCFLQLFMIQ
jgi:hypothetical protein